MVGEHLLSSFILCKTCYQVLYLCSVCLSIANCLHYVSFDYTICILHHYDHFVGFCFCVQKITTTSG